MSARLTEAQTHIRAHTSQAAATGAWGELSSVTVEVVSVLELVIMTRKRTQTCASGLKTEPACSAAVIVLRASCLC